MFLDSPVVILKLPNVRFVKANNQWNIAAELADDPMDSAFAGALTGGIKGVAMVSWQRGTDFFFRLWILKVGFSAVFQFGSLKLRSWTRRCSH